MTQVKYMLVAFTDVTFHASDIPKLRGFFANKYPHDHLFHNHLPGESISYKFPLIQYRIHDQNPALIGVAEGIELMKKVFLDVTEIIIGREIHSSNERLIKLIESPFGQCQNFHNYRFASPWMALNQDNYREFIKLNPMQQKARLKQILKGNLLTLSKGFGYTIPDFDNIEVDGWFKPVERNFHNIPMQCFWGEYTTNFIIPDFLGLGKQCARGFGVVMQDKEDR